MAEIFKVQMEADGDVRCVHICPMQPWERRDGVAVTTGKILAHLIKVGEECRLT